MALDIFSNFDDHNKVYFNMFFLLWVFMLGVVLCPLRKMWVSFSIKSAMTSVVYNLVMGLVKLTRMNFIGGSLNVSIILFTVILYFNLLGLFPYSFSLTSHLTPTLSISLVVWISIVLMSMTFNLGLFLSHFQPEGSPALLNPFLCLIELASSSVRPFTLAIRVTANLMTGHILMGLLGMGFLSSGWQGGVLILMMGVFYTMYELAVCLVQAYIFTLLPTLYTDEHPGV